MEPILFNTEMVRAVLENRKGATRLVVRPQPEPADDIIYKNQECGEWFISPDNDCFSEIEVKPPYRPGNILYVRETFFEYKGRYYYKADGKYEALDALTGGSFFKWRPSIHMPKEAARLFLWVKDVRVERLQEITEEQAILEGIEKRAVPVINASNVFEYRIPGMHNVCISGRGAFSHLWDRTIKKADLPRYGWDANPWVWVINYQKISKEEALKNA